MRLNTIGFGPWELGLDNLYERGNDKKKVRKAHNVSFTREGFIDSINSPVQTGTEAFIFGGGRVINNELQFGSFRHPVADGPYLSTSSQGVTLLSDNEDYFILSDYGITKLDRQNPQVSFTESVVGQLCPVTQFLVVNNGLASPIHKTSAKSVVITGEIGTDVYASHQDGSQFYHAGTITTGSFHLTRNPNGTLLDQRVIDSYPPRPAASHIGLVSGRALFAIGTALYYSEPYSFGSIHTFNVVAFPSRITMIGGVGTTVFVGTVDGVYNIKGLGTDSSVMKKSSDLKVFDSNSLILDSGSELSVESEGEICVWPSEAGMQIGNSDGSVITLKADSLRFSYPEFGRLAYNDGILTFYSRRI